MSSNDDVTIDIGFDVKGAGKQLNKFRKATAKSLESIQNSFLSLKTVAIGAVAFLGARGIVSGIKNLTEAASAQEDAIKKLNIALALSGDFSEEASQGMQDFASSLQAASTIGDEVILDQLALAKSFGLSNDEAKKLIQAAVDLAAATGTSLETAVRNLGKTYGGVTGRVAELLPALRDLTQEELKSGKAIDFVAERFGGAAKALTNTFSGALTQTTNIFGDMLEELGFLITESPLVIAVIKKLGEMFAKLSKKIQDNSETFTALIEDFIKFSTKVLPKFIRGIAGAVRFLDDIRKGFIGIRITYLQFLADLDKLDPSNTAFGQFLEKFVDLPLSGAFKVLAADARVALDGLAEELAAIDGKSGLEKVADFMESIAKETDGLADAVAKAGKAGVKAVAQIEQKSKGFFDKVKESLKEISKFKIGGIDLNKAASAGKIIGTSIQESIAIGVAGFKTFFEGIAQGGFFQQLFDAVQGIADAPQIVLDKFEAFDKFIDKFLGVGDQKSALDRFDEFVKRIPEIVKRITDEFFPAFTKFLNSTATSFLGTLTKAFKGLVGAFVKSLEDTVDNVPGKIADGGIEFIDVILEAVPRIITVLGKAMRQFMSRIGILFKRILSRLPAIIRSIFGMVGDIVGGIITAIPDIVEAFSENLGPIITSFVDGFGELMFKIVDAFILSLENGGMERIVLALVLLGPRIGFAIARASIEGHKRAAKKIGDAMARGFKAHLTSDRFTVIGDKMREAFAEFFANFDKIKKELRNIKVKIKPFKVRIPEPAWVTRFIKAFRSISSGGGGKAGGFKVPGLLEGGQIPGGFPNDTFPARLTSGETVISPGLTNQLERFLNQASTPAAAEAAVQPQNITVSLTVGEEQLANVLLNLDRNGFRVA